MPVPGSFQAAFKCRPYIEVIIVFVLYLVFTSRRKACANKKHYAQLYCSRQTRGICSSNLRYHAHSCWLCLGGVDSTGLRREAINHAFWDRRRVPRSDNDVVLRTACGLPDTLTKINLCNVFLTKRHCVVVLGVISCIWGPYWLPETTISVAVETLLVGAVANLKTHCHCQDEAVHERPRAHWAGDVVFAPPGGAFYFILGATRFLADSSLPFLHIKFSGRATGNIWNVWRKLFFNSSQIGSIMYQFPVRCFKLFEGLVLLLGHAAEPWGLNPDRKRRDDDRSADPQKLLKYAEKMSA